MAAPRACSPEVCGKTAGSQKVAYGDPLLNPVCDPLQKGSAIHGANEAASPDRTH
jgi:hypothetical protein